MLDNEQFIELTDFLHSEFQKIFTTYGPQVLPKKYLNSLTNSILKRYGLINKLESKKLKFNIAVDYAVFTCPHNFIWKIFHPRLWAKVKEALNKPVEEEIEKEELEPEPLPDVVAPAVVARVDLSAMNYPSHLENQ